jgi:hypothetical protein
MLRLFQDHGRFNESFKIAGDHEFLYGIDLAAALCLLFDVPLLNKAACCQ